MISIVDISMEEQGDNMQLMDSIKRFIVVLFTETILCLLGLSILYILYMKNCTIQDILNLILNPLNPLTLIIFGIGAIGGGYVGVKTWENLKNGKEEETKP